MAKKQDPLTSFRPSDYSGFVQSTLAMEKAKAKADDPTLGFSEIATPVVTEIARQIKVTDDAKNLFMENLPDNFQVELVPPEMQPKLTNQLKDYKSEYLEGVELLSKHANNTNSAEYKRGVEITEGAKTKMMNAYNGLVKLQQDRAFEIENNYTRGYVGDPRRANNLITGFNPEQIQFDELGNAVLNDGFGEAVLAKDYQRSHTRNASYGDQIFNVIEVEAVNAGKSNMNKASFDSQINNTLAGLKQNPKDADDMFYLGLSGDNTGETAFKNYINTLDIEDDGKDNNSIKWDGLPPSKSEKTMNQMFDFYKSTANMRYGDGLEEYTSSKLDGDEESITKNLNSLKLQGTPVNLRSLTGDQSDEYLRVQLNKEGNYDLLDQEQQAIRRGDSASDPVITYTPEQMAAMIGVDVSELTGKPAEATTDATAGEGTVLAPPPVSGEEIVDDITPKQETSTKDEVPNSDTKSNVQIFDNNFFGGDRIITLVGVTQEEYDKYIKLPTFRKTKEQKDLKKKVEKAKELAKIEADKSEDKARNSNELDEVITGNASKADAPTQPTATAETESSATAETQAPQGQSTSFRDTFSKQEQKYIDSISVDGSTGANKANILKNGKPITANAGPMGVVKVKGVEARGNELVVTTSMGDQDMGSFKKEGDGYKFAKGNAYQYLKGEDKALFDSMIKGIESDPAYAQEILNAVQGENMFNSKDYATTTEQQQSESDKKKLIKEAKDLPQRTMKDFTKEQGVSKRMSEIAAKHKFDVIDLYKIIQKETGGTFATNVKSGTSSAVGLIQFMPKTIKDLDPSLDSGKVAAMSTLEQLDFIDKYFTKYGKKGAHPYLIVASPKAATMEPNEVLYASGSKEADANPAWQDGDGNVTPNSILIGMGFKNA